MDTDPLYDQAAEPERLRDFITELEENEFKRVSDVAWEGPTRQSLLDEGLTESPTMRIIIRPSWPYLCPLLDVPGISSWHADQERLCLWRSDDASQRWVTLDGINERIDEWVTHAVRGFEAVENARNPEIYWQEETSGVVYGLVEIDALMEGTPSDGQHGEFHFGDAASAGGRPSPVVVFDLHPGAFSPMTPIPKGIESYRQVRGRWFYRASIGHPPRTISEFRTALTERQRERLDKDLRDRTAVMFGLFWRNAAGLVATVLLEVRQGEERNRHLVALRPKGRPALLLRAGPDAGVLQGKRVAIIGVGAIGSNLADQLARAGVGELHLYDFDRLWPANLIRHAAPPGTPAGTLKTAALKENLERFPWVRVVTPDAQHSALVWTLPAIKAVLGAVDLTIDASGHGGLAELIARVAHHENRPFVSVALFRGGSVARVRRQSRTQDTPIIARPHLDGYPEIPPLDEELEYVGTETGCLAQVHNAPPTSVIQAAVLAAEVGIDILTARFTHPDELIEVIRPGEPPYDRAGRIRAEDLPRTIDVSESATQTMRVAAAAAVPRETGGVLIGTTIDGRSVVVEAVELVDPNATEESYQVGAGVTSAAVADAHKRDSRLGYMGEWHSHARRVGPSVLDTATMMRAMNESGNPEPLLVLIHPEASAGADVEAYVTTIAGLKKVNVVATGDLPESQA